MKNILTLTLILASVSAFSQSPDSSNYFYQKGLEEKMLVKLAKANPNDAEIMYTVGKTYMEMELEQKAIYYYQKAISLKSDNATWNFELGMLYYVSENYKNAVVFFNKALALGFPV